MSKPNTLKEWLREWIGQCVPDADNEPCETCVKTNPEKSHRCAEAEDTIRRLIENGPEVTRGFVVNSARAMGAAPDALAMVLEEAGVEVEE